MVRNPSQNRRSSVPRHTEINDNLARKICKRPRDKTYKVSPITPTDGVGRAAAELRSRVCRKSQKMD